MKNSRIDIEGIDLQIDDSIQKTCEVSNATSSNTRSILYILVIVNILALIAVVNTRPGNWFKYRIKAVQTEINNVKKSNPATAVAYSDSCRHRLDSLQGVLNILIRNKVENIQTVRVPILGNTFDVNDLGLVSGLTFIVLMVILRFTIMREINNLKIALASITERYPSTANPEAFAGFIARHLGKPENRETGEAVILEAINYTRRKHHYNYLSMNEIYTLPPLEIDNNSLSNTFIERVIKKMYWLPFVVMLLIILNDILTVDAGFLVSNFNTIIGIVIGLVCASFIAVLSHLCTRQKETISRLYEEFQANGYSCRVTPA